LVEKELIGKLIIFCSPGCKFSNSIFFVDKFHPVGGVIVNFPLRGLLTTFSNFISIVLPLITGPDKDNGVTLTSVFN
jgi:hypothetical protein